MHLAASATSPTHVGLDLATSDSRAKMMVRLTDTPLFFSHVISGAGAAVS